MPLISEAYRSQQQTLHETTDYGTMAGQYAPIISKIMNKLEVTHLLDYGCGHNLSLFKSLKVNHRFTYQAYDPCVPEYSANPVPAEMVACVDVLEHIEPDYIDDVLDHLRSVTEALGFFSVATGPALKTLPDGRNAHILQMPAEWWLPKFMDRFDVQTYQKMGDHGFFVIVHSIAGEIEGLDGDKLDNR